MTDNKLYIVLTYFDRIEQNRLRKYIRSPYFNVNETLMDLFDIIIQYIDKNEGKIEKRKRSKLDTSHLLTKEGIWQKLFKIEPYNDTRFRKLSSELLKLVEGYLAQEIYENKPLQQINYLFEAVGDKRIEKLYTSTERNARLISTHQNLKPADYYYYQYLIEKNYYESLDVDMQRGEKSNVEKIINYLDEFYLAEKLKWYDSLLSRKSIVNHDFKVLFIDEIIEHIQKYPYEHNIVISIYTKVLLTRIYEDIEQNFHDLCSLLEKNIDKFSKTEQYELYSCALNYCIRKFNKGESKFMSLYHELFEKMLENEVAFYAISDGSLSPWDFKNTILFSLRLGKYEWTENFIQKYKNRLPKEFRDNAVSYNLALVYFYQKKFNKVMELLREVEYEDISYSLGSKSMLMAIYYEQDELDALFSLSDSFKTFLSRHKDINDGLRNPYLQYIHFVRKLTKIKNGDKKSIEQIRQEIKDAKGVASEKWLLEKLAELE